MVELPAPRRPVQAEAVTIPVAASGAVAATAMPAWWARPQGRQARGAVLVLPEVFGVNGWLRSVAERLAGEGYGALAINPFSRTAAQLDLGYDAAALELGRQHRDQVTADQLLADAAAAAAWLQDRHGQRPLGCVGFCFGGHLALIAATLPYFAASCDFYGARVGSFRPGGGAPSLELVGQIPGRLWCFCGDADPLIPAADRAAIAAALRAANRGVAATDPGARHRLITAAGAGHGYLCEARADFQAAAAQQGWSAMLALFAEALAEPAAR
jgi:carboxymethylenebutenolidase